MLRGTTLFRCPNCGHVFKALDIEDNAIVYSMPMPCPRCGAKSSPVGISAAWLALHPLVTNSFIFVASECRPAPLGDILPDFGPIALTDKYFCGLMDFPSRQN